MKKELIIGWGNYALGLLTMYFIYRKKINKLKKTNEKLMDNNMKDSIYTMELVRKNEELKKMLRGEFGDVKEKA